MSTQGPGDGEPFDGMFAGEGRDSAEQDEAPPPPRRRRRGLRIAIVSLVVLVLLGVGSVAGYLAFLNHKITDNITHEPLLPTDGATMTGEDGAMVTMTPPPPRPAPAGEALNVLFVGSDSRDLSAERGRSDVIVLMHIASDRSRVDLIHFPRDLFVEIPGYSHKNKVNASYAFGGMPLLVQTLQPLIGVPIDHVVLVNFESFKAMTDAIGGVDVNVAQASPGFPEGTMAMDGETGLRFVRERYALSQGDISRGQRQMAFIKAIMVKALSRDTVLNPVTLANFVDAATTNLVVDDQFEVAQMRDLGLSLRSLRGEDIHFLSAPWTGLGSDKVAGSIVLPAPEQMAKLREHLQEDTMDAYVDDVSPKSGFG